MRYSSVLVHASVISISALAQAAAVPRNTGSACQRTKVAILGAGVAGLTAAEALSNDSISDFLIVERNHYIGGRAHHTNFGKRPDGTSYTVELGANWLQGLSQPQGPANPLWLLAQKYGLRTVGDNDSLLLTYDKDGYNDYTTLLDEYGEADSFSSAYSAQLLNENRPDVSGRTGLALGGWRPKQSDIHRQAVEWFRWDFESAVSPETNSLLSAVASDNVTFLDGMLNQFVVDGDGLNKIFIKQSEEFLTENDPRLMLNTIVRNITYSSDGVRVDMDDGTCIQADHAICTFSVGVLQNDVVQFSPALPEWKLEAIYGFQMATYTKIFMQFNESFWDGDTQYFLYADPVTRGWYPLFQSLNAPGFFEGSNILFCTVTGPMSYVVENQSDEETKSQIMEVLRTMFPDKDIPEPVDFMYPRWTKEEWAYGSYSNWPIGTSLQTHQNLRANLQRLWFAGEANSAEFYGYLHGAWYEGKAIAARIAAVLNGKCSLDDTSSSDCGSLIRYEPVHGATKPSEYNRRNGWEFNTFTGETL